MFLAVIHPTYLFVLKDYERYTNGLRSTRSWLLGDREPLYQFLLICPLLHAAGSSGSEEEGEPLLSKTLTRYLDLLLQNHPFTRFVYRCFVVATVISWFFPAEYAYYMSYVWDFVAMVSAGR